MISSSTSAPCSSVGQAGANTPLVVKPLPRPATPLKREHVRPVQAKASRGQKPKK